MEGKKKFNQFLSAEKHLKHHISFTDMTIRSLAEAKFNPEFACQCFGYEDSSIERKGL